MDLDITVLERHDGTHSATAHMLTEQGTQGEFVVDALGQTAGDALRALATALDTFDPGV